MSDPAQLVTLNAILRIGSRHANLLSSPAFEEVARVLGAAMTFGLVVVILYETPDEMRVYAQARGSSKPTVLPFGERFRVSPGARWVTAGAPRVCDDTREGTPLERQTAEAGYLSYVGVPILAEAEPRQVLGQLIVTFTGLGEASRAPMDLLLAVADVFASNLERARASARERRLAMILETSGDAMLAWDRGGIVTDANGAAATLAGVSRDALIGRNVRELLSPLPDSASPPQGERLELVAEGKRVAVAATITSVDDDPLVAAHALLRDLSVVAQAEREAAMLRARERELEEQHEALLDNAPLIIFRLDADTAELRYLNRYAEHLLGVPRAEALATPGFLRDAHATPEGLAAFDEAVARARRGAQPLPYEARLRQRDGAEITARGNLTPVLSDGGPLASIEGILADVSAEHAARTRLVQTDRLSTLGTLAAGVAHEINNPAAFILLGLDMLDRLLSGPGVHIVGGAADNATELLGGLRDSIKRIVDIARDLRVFASPPAKDLGRRTVLDVRRTVESALTLTRGQILERARVVLDLADVPPVLMDDGRLGQVVVNLLVNAAQSIPKPSGGGDEAVTVVTRSDTVTVEIEVSDTGVGIPVEHLHRIWTPFFTTKSADVGTGLGLSISHEIIERAGGTIRVDSPVPGSLPPRGSRFTISLPAAGRGEIVTPVSSPLPRVRPASVKLLVVEDEPSLARALAEELGRVHEVTLAGDAVRALEELERRPFNVVLCDLRMPGMSGEALFAEVARRDPSQASRFLFMTGVGFGPEVERFLAESGRPLIEKPFSTAHALEAIGRIFRRAGAVEPEAKAPGRTA